MAKVTSKLQVSLPKSLADLYRIRPGDEIDWQAAGDVIRVIPGNKQSPVDDVQTRLHLFDQATQRQRKRSAVSTASPTAGRGWRREDLYRRGRTR